MAQLKDTIVSGSLRATDTIYTTTLQAQIINAPTASNGTTYGPGTNEYVLMSNGTSIYWGTGVSNAIKALDASFTGATNKTLTALTQTDGKITTATFNDIAINESQVTWSNNTLYAIGDDVSIGDVNVGGHLGVKGKNGNTGIMFTTYNQSTNTTGGKVTWDGSKFILTGTAPTLGTSNIGSERQLFYLNAGVPTNGNYVVSHLGNAGKSNMNDIGRLHASMGMTNLTDPGNIVDNPGNAKGWHHYIDINYTDDPNGANAWVTQFANKAGTTDLWMRSRNGSTITNGTAWTAPWTRVLTESNIGQGLNTDNVVGFNLLPQTQDMQGYGGTENRSDTPFPWCYSHSITGGTGTTDLAYNNIITPEPDTWYTLSFYAKASATVEIINHFYGGSGTTVVEGYNCANATTASSDGNIKLTIGTIWKRYWVCYKTGSNTSGAKNLIFGRLSAKEGITLYIALPKFEIGRIATGWSPNPGDAYHIYGRTGNGNIVYNGGGGTATDYSLILHGNSTNGSSGIAFLSSKGNNTINYPSDRAFIQFHPYGVSAYSTEGNAPTLATSGEAATLVIGVGNDATDTIHLQTPGRTGLYHQVANNYFTIPDTGNTTGTVGSSSLPVYVNAGAITAVTAKDACNAFINALDTGSSTLTANDYIITQYVGGGTTTTTYHRRPASAVRVGGLLTARKLKVALNSTTDATFDGTADQTSIPVSGTLGVANGGTGQASYTIGDILYASSASALSKLGGNTTITRKFLLSAATTSGTAVAPKWDTVTATDVGLSDVTNTAALNKNTGTKGDIIYWNAKDTPAHLTNTSSTTKHFLSITSQVPAWTTLSKSDVGLGNVTNDAQVKASLGTTKGDLLYWSAKSSPTNLSIGTNGQFLTVSNGAPAWTTLTASNIPNLSTDKLTSGTLPISRGGTGVTNAADARTLFLAATGNARVFYGTCDTADSTVAKVVTCSVYPDLQTGDILIVKFSHTNTGAVANLTLNVNNQGAKGIRKQYNNTLANLTHAGELRADTIAEFIYNGQYWILANADYNNTYNYSSLQSASGASRMAENTTNGGIGLHGYTLQLMTLNQAWSSIACTNGSTANNSGTTTQKTPARADFLLDAPILYMTDNKYVAPQTESNVSGYTAYACNFLYNTSGNVTLSIQQPVYLVGILNSDKVTFKLDENQWWTQSLPTQQDPQAKSNKIYILLGLAYSATNIYLLPYHPAYYHNGIRIQLLSGSGGGTGTWIGTEAPEEESYNLWVDTDEDATGAMVLRGDAIKMLNFTIASSKWTLHDGLYVTELPFGSTSGTRASTNANYTANGINVDDVVLSLQILTNKHLIQDGTLSWETSNGSLLLKSTQQITNTITGYVVLGTSMGFVPTIVAQNPVF